MAYYVKKAKKNILRKNLEAKKSTRFFMVWMVCLAFMVFSLLLYGCTIPSWVPFVGKSEPAISERELPEDPNSTRPNQSPENEPSVSPTKYQLPPNLQKIPGEDEFLRGDYQSAYSLMAPLYPQGDIRAVFYLRIMLEHGLTSGGPYPTEAQRSMDYLASKGEEIKYLATHAPLELRPVYQTILGTLYLKGIYPNSPKNLPEAHRWAGFAANQGFVPAMNLMAAIINDPEPTKVLLGLWTISKSECFSWTLKAAETGDLLAIGNLSYLYRVGIGVESDTLRAVTWAYQAALAKPPLARAQNDVGAYYEEGRAVSPSLKEAQRWYELAKKQSPLAQQNLERLKHKQEGPIFSGDISY
jgi:TPR repeat protein